jgi:hypothetical protein
MDGAEPHLHWIPAIAALACGAAPYGVAPAGQAQATPRIALVIDDLGYRREDGERALALPGPVAYAFLPHTPHGTALVERARASGRTVLLHVPMQAAGRARSLGPGALVADMERARFERTLDRDLQSVPGAVGVNNHMGSLLTRRQEPMDWLMQWLRASNLMFIDSRTTAYSVAARSAHRHGVPVLERDVFLDDRRDRAAVHEQFRRLVVRARARGYALGIAHPHPATLDVLEEELARLVEHGVTLAPVSELLPPMRMASAKPDPRTH